MMRLAPSFMFALALAAPLPAVPRDPVLDWSAPRVLVHADSVAADKVELFEGARRRWLARVRKDGAYRPDGRPLFFSTRRDDGVVRYLTFYPFATWGDLDARGAATKRTEAAVGGKAAVDEYDSGDQALVPPHYSQVWYRLADLDYAARSLPEARALRLEMREMPVGATADALDAVWPEVQKELTVAGYPVAARGYWSLFGTGHLVLLWLAPDGAALDPALPLSSALRTRLDAAAPIRETVRFERRDDLSNLP
jgi:hypothetical protein